MSILPYQTKTEILAMSEFGCFLTMKYNPYFWFTVLLSEVRTKKVQQLCFQVSDRNANELDSLLKPNPSVKKKIYFQLSNSKAQIIQTIDKKA